MQICTYIHAKYVRVCMRNVNTDLADFDYETAIYYGDSNVNIGEPFSITCIVPLAEPIFWLKDGEPITRHNLRHGRDEHSYTLSESAIEGEYNQAVGVLAISRHNFRIQITSQIRCCRPRSAMREKKSK